jgi:hypothetical protein
MDRQSLLAHLREWLDANSYNIIPPAKDQPQGAGLVVRQGRTTWRLYLVDQPSPDTAGPHPAFDQAVARAIEDTRSAPAGGRQALCIPLGSKAPWFPLPLQRAMKKYSNSIVFEDLELSLWLVSDQSTVEIIPPASVNNYLRNLDAAASSKPQDAPAESSQTG